MLIKLRKDLPRAIHIEVPLQYVREHQEDFSGYDDLKTFIQETADLPKCAVVLFAGGNVVSLLADEHGKLLCFR